MAAGSKIAPKDSPYYSNLVGDVVCTVGAEAGNAISVSCQLKDYNGNNLDQRASIRAYLASDITGDTVATAPDGGVVVSTDGIVFQLVTNTLFQLITEANGKVGIQITESTAKTFYLIFVYPDGTIKKGATITFV